MQRELTEKIVLLNQKGCLARPGWARQMHYIYNRERAKTTPINLKEWNFYQFIKDHWVVQLTIGHVSYACSVTATLLNLDTGEKREANSMRLFHTPALDTDPEGPGVSEYRTKDFAMRFEVTERRRLLTFEGKSGRWGDVFIHLDAENDPGNEKMVIATPFDKPHQFYLNYKENYYQAAGFARFGKDTVYFDGAAGLLDWGRGIWPYRHEWWWGNLTAQVDGADFGFNIGWGFGDLSHATENMFFYKRKAYKLGTLQVWMECGCMAPRHLKDEEGRMELHFRPIYDNYTQNKLGVVDTHCNQVYGLFDGFAMTDEGRVDFHDLLAFLEHAVNRW